MQSYDARGEGGGGKCMIKKRKGGKREMGTYKRVQILSSIISKVRVHKRTFCRNAPGAIVCESLLLGECVFKLNIGKQK